MYLELAQQSVKGHPIFYGWFVELFCTEFAIVILFRNKRQVWSSASALPNQWCSISLTVLLISSIGIKEILTCSIIWLLKYCHTIRWLNKILNLRCCFVVDFPTRFLFMNKICFSRYSDNVGAYSLYDIGPQMRMWVTVVNPIGMG